MTIYKESKVQIFDKKSKVKNVEVCDITIKDGEIIIGYEKGTNFVVYQGKSEGCNHFKITSSNKQFKAKLHIFKGDNKLFGTWSELDRQGTWLVVLGEPSPDLSPIKSYIG